MQVLSRTGRPDGCPASQIRRPTDGSRQAVPQGQRSCHAGARADQRTTKHNVVAAFRRQSPTVRNNGIINAAVAQLLTIPPVGVNDALCRMAPTSTEATGTAWAGRGWAELVALALSSSFEAHRTRSTIRDDRRYQSDDRRHPITVAVEIDSLPVARGSEDPSRFRWSPAGDDLLRAASAIGTVFTQRKETRSRQPQLQRRRGESTDC